MKSDGSVLEGPVMASTGGKLACQKVVHVVGCDFEAKILIDMINDM